MSDRDSVRHALSLALQADAYSRLGPHAADLAATARHDFDAAVAGWTAAARAGIGEALAGLCADHSELDRGRNHFIKAFRARHGADARAYPAALKAEFDAGVAQFTSKKQEALDAAADRLLEIHTRLEKSA